MIVQVASNEKNKGLKKGDIVCLVITGVLIGFGEVIETGGNGIKFKLDETKRKHFKERNYLINLRDMGEVRKEEYQMAFS